MKVLVIISQFLPAQDPNSIRWAAICKEFVAGDIETTVLTTRRDPLPTDSREDGIRIIRTGHNTMRDYLYNRIKKRSRRHEPGYVYRDYGKLRNVFKKCADIFYRGIYWPDGSWLFLNPGIQKGLEIVDQHRITHIISVGAPFTCHLIAARIKEMHPQIHWNMDIQDPFSFAVESGINNEMLYEHKNFRSERACLKIADSITHTNQTALKKYETLFPFVKNKSTVIPPIFVKPGLPETGSPDCTHPDEDKTHLAYFGSFYENLRSPENFLRFLELFKNNYPELFEKLCFHMIGQANSYSSRIFNKYPHISDQIKFHGFLSRDTTMLLLSKMDILINIGNKTDYHLPSRSVEYLYFNKPLINFIETREDALSQFVSGQLELLEIEVNGDIHTSAMLPFVDFVNKDRKKSCPDISKVQDYLPEQIYSKYLALLKI